MMRLILCSFTPALALLACVANPAFGEDFSRHNRFKFAPQYFALEHSTPPPVTSDQFNVRDGRVNAPRMIVFDDVLLQNPDLTPLQPYYSLQPSSPAYGPRANVLPSPPGFGQPSPLQVMSPPLPAAPPSHSTVVSVPHPNEQPLHIVRYFKSTNAHLATAKAAPAPTISAGEPASYPHNSGYSYYGPALSSDRYSASTEVRAVLMPKSSGR